MVRGTPSAVYIDDVFQAMLHAAQRGGAGERFTIPLVAMTAAEMRAARRSQWKGAVRALIPETLVALKASPGVRAAAVALPKACAQLGYDPVYDLARGMALTRQWGHWANLLPPPGD